MWYLKCENRQHWRIVSLALVLALGEKYERNMSVIPVKTFPSVSGIFFAWKTGMGLGCTIYIIQMNLLLPLGGKKVICPPE